MKFEARVEKERGHQKKKKTFFPKNSFSFLSLYLDRQTTVFVNTKKIVSIV